MKILITGSAGFIGSALTLNLLSRGYEILGLDNINNYYDPTLKKNRLKRHFKYKNYNHVDGDIEDQSLIERVFKDYKPQRVVNLAAHVGVRNSINKPFDYIKTNILGFANILEGCRHNGVDHLIYASSSSVYGANTKIPFSVHHNVDHPISLYAATKKSNELMAHSYSHLYNLPTTGLRFFTVYGPWGRPDMALFKFTKSILSGETIDVFNKGNNFRDFTYIDDIVKGIINFIDQPAETNKDWLGFDPDPSTSNSPWQILNLGSGNPIKLIKFIEIIENIIGLKAKINFLPSQLGDMHETHADLVSQKKNFKFINNTSVEKGISNFFLWYKNYYKF